MPIGILKKVNSGEHRPFGRGGIGLLILVLIVMNPTISAMFSSGTLGQFAANSSFGNL